MLPKINYLNNKDMLSEIHKSKSSFCSFVKPEYHQYDIILSSLDKINIRFIRCPSSIKTKIQDQLTLFKKIKTGQNNTIDKNQIYGFFDEKEGKFKLVNKEEETGVLRLYNKLVKAFLELKLLVPVYKLLVT